MYDLKKDISKYNCFEDFFMVPFWLVTIRVNPFFFFFTDSQYLSQEVDIFQVFFPQKILKYESMSSSESLRSFILTSAPYICRGIFI